MIRPGAGDAASAALGVLAGIILWAVTAAALYVAGLSSYALNTALPVALVVTAVATPAILRWTRSRAPRHVRQRLGVLFGALAFLVYASIVVILAVPETIMFLG